MPDPKSSSSSRSRDRNSAVREQLNALREEIEAALRQGKSAQSEIQDTLAKQHHSVMERLESALKPDVARPSMDRLRSAQEYRQKQPEAPVVDEFSDIRAFSWEPEAPEGRPTTHTRFNFNESKTVEFLVFIAARWPGITPFFVAKVLFFADRDHLRAYGRPVTGDVYIAMPDGPVPSHVYDMVKGNLDFFGDPEAIAVALRVDRNQRYPRLYAERDPNLDLLSETDITALRRSVSFCQERSFRDLSNLTHQEVAWIEAAPNGEINPEKLVPEDMREEVREAAAYAVL